MLPLVAYLLLAQQPQPLTPPEVVLVLPAEQALQLAGAIARIELELRAMGFAIRPAQHRGPEADLAWEAAALLASASAPEKAITLSLANQATMAEVWQLTGVGQALQGWTVSAPLGDPDAAAVLALRVAEILHALAEGLAVEAEKATPPPAPPSPPPRPAPPPPPPPAAPELEHSLEVGVQRWQFARGLQGAWLPYAGLASFGRGGFGLAAYVAGWGTSALGEAPEGSVRIDSRALRVLVQWQPLRRRGAWLGRLSPGFAAGPALLNHHIQGKGNVGFEGRDHTMWQPAATAEATLGIRLVHRVFLQLAVGARFARSLGLRFSEDVPSRTGWLGWQGGAGISLAL